MEVDHISDMEAELKRLAHTLYQNPRVGKVSMHCDTLMGCSVSYLSEGDPDSPYCKALEHKAGLDEAKHIDSQNAIQNGTGPSPRYPAASKESPRDIQGGLQQWI